VVVTWVLLGAAWLAFNVGFVAGCRWANRRPVEPEYRVTDLRASIKCGDEITVPRPDRFIHVSLEN
jgi:hypothetical protein